MLVSAERAVGASVSFLLTFHDDRSGSDDRMERDRQAGGGQVRAQGQVKGDK